MSKQKLNPYQKKALKALKSMGTKSAIVPGSTFKFHLGGSKILEDFKRNQEIKRQGLVVTSAEAKEPDNVVPLRKEA